MLEEIAKQISQQLKNEAKVCVCKAADLPMVLAFQSFAHKPEAFVEIYLIGKPSHNLLNFIPKESADTSCNNDADINEMPITLKLVLKLYSVSRDELEKTANSILEAFNEGLGFRFMPLNSDKLASYPIELSRYSNPIKEGSQYVLFLGYDGNIDDQTVPISFSDISAESLIVDPYTKNELVCFYVYYLILSLNASHPNHEEIEKRAQRIKTILNSPLTALLKAHFSSLEQIDYSDYFQLKNEQLSNPDDDKTK